MVGGVDIRELKKIQTIGFLMDKNVSPAIYTFILGLKKNYETLYPCFT